MNNKILNNKLFLKGLVIAIISLVLDQAHKFYMLESYRIAEIGKVEVTSFLNFVMVWNRGISFGMFSGHDYSNYIFISVASIISVILLVWLKKTNIKIEAYGIGFVIGGAIGNLIDRMRFGAVADFFDFHVAGYHWPAFNIADSSIFIGACILIISSLFFQDKNIES
jgi:signal peptidase II